MVSARSARLLRREWCRRRAEDAIPFENFNEAILARDRWKAAESSFEAFHLLLADSPPLMDLHMTPATKTAP